MGAMSQEMFNGLLRKNKPIIDVMDTINAVDFVQTILVGSLE